MATQAQKDAVAKYQSTNDSTDLLVEYPDNGYAIEGSNPYELRNVIANGGTVISIVVTGVTSGTAITVDGASVDSVVTYESDAGTGALTYVSDTPAVATVDAAGVVTLVGSGSAIITATSVENGTFSGTTAVTFA